MKNSRTLRSAFIVAIICAAVASITAWWLIGGKPTPLFELGNNVMAKDNQGNKNLSRQPILSRRILCS